MFVVFGRSLQLDDLTVNVHLVEGYQSIVVVVIEDVLSIMGDDGIVGDELAGDYSVFLRVEVKKLQRLCFACFNRKIYLSGG